MPAAPPTLACARALRDGGIDAMAALDSALALALAQAPESTHGELKLAIGQAMSAIMDETINPAVRAFPELVPSEAVWRQVVQDRLSARAGNGRGPGDTAAGG